MSGFLVSSRVRTVNAALLVATWLFPVHIAGAQTVATLGVFEEDNCGSCATEIPVGTTKDLTVSLTITDVFAVGSIEFAIRGIPRKWLATAVPDDGIRTINGDPLQEGGVWIVPKDGYDIRPCMTLYKLRVTATTNEQALIHVVGQPAAASGALCPNVIYLGCQLCEVFVGICATGGQIFVNSPEDDCSVSVANSLWSQVKLLYR